MVKILSCSHAETSSKVCMGWFRLSCQFCRGMDSRIVVTVLLQAAFWQLKSYGRSDQCSVGLAHPSPLIKLSCAGSQAPKGAGRPPPGSQLHQAPLGASQQPRLVKTGEGRCLLRRGGSSSLLLGLLRLHSKENTPEGPALGNESLAISPEFLLISAGASKVLALARPQGGALAGPRKEADFRALLTRRRLGGHLRSCPSEAAEADRAIRVFGHSRERSLKLFADQAGHQEHHAGLTSDRRSRQLFKLTPLLVQQSP